MQKIVYILFLGLLVSACATKTKVATPTAVVQNDPEAFRATAPGAKEASVIKIGDYEVFNLPNGLKVVLVENHKIPRVSYSLSLLNNPVLEGEKAGYVGIAGDLLGRGTTSRSKAELDETVDFIGANLSTSANGVYGSALTKHQDKLLEVYTDVLYNPSFPESELEKIITQTLTSLAQSKQDAGSIAANVGNVINFSKNHPYGEVETEESVQKVNVEDCKTYYQKYFRPDNAILTIVGDIDLDAAKMKANKYFAQWEKPQTSFVDEKLIDVKIPQSTQVAFAQKDGSVQSQIQIVYPVDLKKGSPDAIKVSVMNTILGGGGFMGRLMQNLREDKAYTYGARSNISSDQFIGEFSAGASVRNEVTDSAIVQFLFEMDRMAKEDVSADDLRMAKSVLAGGFARAMESPQTIASFAYNTIVYNYPSDYYATYLQRLDAVTVQDIREMATKYIRADKANIIVVGEKDDVAAKLVKFDKDGVVDFYDPFGNKLELAKEIATPVDLDGKAVLNNYIEALGGIKKMNEVKTVKMVAGMNLMGQDFEMTIIKKAPNLYYQTMGNESMTIQEQVFDGTKAKMSGMGGSQIITEGEELDAIKKEAAMFPELDYLSDEYTLELKGIEKVDNADAYKVLATDAADKKQTMFFDVKSGLLVKRVATESARGQTVTVATLYKEYADNNGIMFPGLISVIGGAPFPINMKFKSVEINIEVPESTFIIK
jgi:zinc protease